MFQHYFLYLNLVLFNYSLAQNPTPKPAPEIKVTNEMGKSFQVEFVESGRIAESSVNLNQPKTFGIPMEITENSCDRSKVQMKHNRKGFF